jgi:lipid-binding SYLF domain-containing protein
MRTKIRFSLVVLMMTVFTAVCFTQPAMAADAKKLNQEVANALKQLYAATPAAKELSKVAKGILVFPSIMKVGFLAAAAYGEGALLVGGKTAGYYNSVAASYGLQAGAQKFGYAMFFMDNASLEYLQKSAGWELGVGPSIVFVDAGMARTLSTSTAKEGIYAFTFNQKGLMAGMGLQGSKITRIKP